MKNVSHFTAGREILILPRNSSEMRYQPEDIIKTLVIKKRCKNKDIPKANEECSNNQRVTSIFKELIENNAKTSKI